jgi:mercuric reductase
MQPASSNCAAASPDAEVRQLEQRLTSVLRPGVLFPDWSAVTSAAARSTLVAMIEVTWNTRVWRQQTAAEDEMRRAILELYARLGRAPAPEEIGMASEHVFTLLHRQAKRDLVVLDGDRLTGAYPLTDRRTEHRVRVEGPTLHAMCAIDALGVGAMYGTSSVIESRCRLCRAAIDITTADRGRRLETVLPAETMVLAGIAYRGGCAATSLCTTIAFFCSEAHLRQWPFGQASEGTGFRLSSDEAFEVGRAIFGPTLAPPALQVQPEPTACSARQASGPRPW